MNVKNPKLLLLTAAFLFAADFLFSQNSQKTMKLYTPVYSHAMVPMRDGVKLFTDIFLPAAEGEWPVIMIRSPYGGGVADRSKNAFCEDFAKQGIAFICQDCRGTGDSEGDARLWLQERDDAADNFEWLAKQPWFNGRVVSNGESYPGNTQWQAARNANPMLVGMTPHDAPFNLFRSAYYPGGENILALGLPYVWAFGVRNRRLGGKNLESNLAKITFSEPLEKWDCAAGIGEWSEWQTWLKHPTYDDFWRAIDTEPDTEKIIAPAYITGGWFDAFLIDTLRSFQAMRSRAGTENARAWTRCCIQPLDHDMKTHEVDYGENHLYPIIETRNRFMRNVLTDPAADPLPDEPPLRIFVMGANRYIAADSWPLPGTKELALSLDSFERKPPTFSFTYDPAAPCPTLGGNNLAWHTAGQHEQSQIEARDDVLVFTSAELTSPLNVIGEVYARLKVSFTAQAADFTVKLCDVFPDGKSYNVCDGIVRVKQGESRAEVFMWATATTFLPGHRIRVQISGANHPRHFRNSNAGEQTVFAAESQLLLPIIESL